jgi:ribosome-binding ATPase YchF (GTP1/OBG family)
VASRLVGPVTCVAAICGKLEAELSEMEKEDETEMREALGVPESSLNRMIRLSYQVLGLVSFFTHGGGEVKAWPVTYGTPAVKAAGRVHSDMERGFIRAEVVGYDDLVTSGGWQNARKAGLLRREGREYLVSDGDVINFLFSV